MKAEIPEKSRKSFISAYKINIFMPVDIVEVVDSSSTTPTILHQAKPLETSSFPTVFLFSGSSPFQPADHPISMKKKQMYHVDFPCIFLKIMLYYLLSSILNPETVKDSA